MSNIEVSEKNDWVLILILVASIILLVFGIEGCTPKLYQYKVTFENGNYDYYELTYKLKNGSKVIEYDGETIMGVKDFELIK